MPHSSLSNLATSIKVRSENSGPTSCSPIGMPEPLPSPVHEQTDHQAAETDSNSLIGRRGVVSECAAYTPAGKTVDGRKQVFVRPASQMSNHTKRERKRVHPTR